MWEWYIRCIAPVSAKAIMATLPDEEVKRSGTSIIEKKTDKTITDFSQMQEVLMKCGRMATRWMMRRTKRASAASRLPARLPERGKNTRSGISGPTSRMTRERVKELAVDVKKVQEELSRELGYYKS